MVIINLRSEIFFVSLLNRLRSFVHSCRKLRPAWPVMTMLLTIYLSFPIPAQIKNVTFEHITMEEGISQSTVLAVTQDQEGYLWLGTQEGLNRYDGYGFTVYKYDPFDNGSLSDNWITCLLTDREGNLWIGTSAGGLNYYDRSSNSFTKYRYDKDDPSSITDDRILSLYQDQSGSLWVGTMGGGLNRFDHSNKQFERYSFTQNNTKMDNIYDVTSIGEDSEGNLLWGTSGAGLYLLNWRSSKLLNYRNIAGITSSLSNDYVSCVYLCQHGNFWVGTLGGGLNSFDSKTRTFTRFQNVPAQLYSLSNNYIYSIAEDTEGHLWIGTDEGLNQFQSKQKRFYNFKNDPADPYSLSNSMVRTIYEDMGGIIWIGTYSGALNKFDRKKAVFKNYYQNPVKVNTLSDRNVWSICEDNMGYLWIGTNNGLNRLDRNTEEFVHFFHDPANQRSLSHNLVRTIYQDRKGGLWIGTEGGGLNRYDDKKKQFKRYVHDPHDSSTLSDNGLRHLFEDNAGNLWVATINGLNKYDRKRDRFKRYHHNPNDPNSLAGNHVRYIYQDRRGAIWVATFNGLSLYLKKQDKFISFRNNPANSSSLSNDRVLCLYEDRQGNFWVGTYGGGLDRLDRDEFIFTHFSKQNGLPNNSVYGILEDQQGNLWMSTNQGISSFNPRTAKFRNFDSNDGLQSNEFNGNAFYQNHKGEMFFGGIKGVTVFVPENVKSNLNIPPIVITSFRKYDQEIYPYRYVITSGPIELKYQDKFFSFEFAALDFTNPSKNQYFYKLEGFDKDWIYCGYRRFANYTNLSGGKYIFRVKGSNNDGLWNEQGVSLNLIIHPPFWQTWWFKFLIVISTLLLIYLIVMLRMRSVNSQKKKLELEVAQRTRELNQSNYELLKAKRDTDDIFNNVEEGLFLLNKDFDIGAQYSLTLEKMLNEQNLANINFLKLVDKKISPDIMNTTREFLELMYREDVDEVTLKDLNPLIEVEINFTDENNSWINSKYLSFNFQRIYDDSDIHNLIVTVSDVTEQVVLTRKLKQSEERTQNQMDWLVNILHIEPPLLNEFMEGVENELNYIDSLLKEQGDNGNLSNILEDIYRSMHLIKGNSALLDLKFFVDLAHQFEERINDVKRSTKLHGKDFVPLVLQLGEMRQSLKEVKKLIDRMSHYHHHFESKKSQDSDLLIRSLRNLIQNQAKELGKEVEFNYDHFQTTTLPYKYRLLVKEILVQLIRNAIFHGIENPQERIKVGKRRLATITLSSEINAESFTLRFRDDGRGLQLDQLKKKAKQSEKWSSKRIETWHRDKIINLIFESGITTVDSAHRIAGRGIGLDLIHKKLSKVKGNVKVEFEEDRFCEFTIQIPLKVSRKRKNIKPRAEEKITTNSLAHDRD